MYCWGGSLLGRGPTICHLRPNIFISISDQQEWASRKTPETFGDISDTFVYFLVLLSIIYAWLSTDWLVRCVCPSSVLLFQEWYCECWEARHVECRWSPLTPSLCWSITTRSHYGRLIISLVQWYSLLDGHH